MDLKKSEKRCWVVWADAPDGTTMRAANDAFNDFVGDESRGLLLFHDHFRKRRLPDLFEEYTASDLGRRNAERELHEQ